MATIESYETSTGAKRYMVRYRTPQHTQTKRRGFTTMRMPGNSRQPWKCGNSPAPM